MLLVYTAAWTQRASHHLRDLKTVEAARGNTKTFFSLLLLLSAEMKKTQTHTPPCNASVHPPELLLAARPPRSWTHWPRPVSTAGTTRTPSLGKSTEERGLGLSVVGGRSLVAGDYSNSDYCLFLFCFFSVLIFVLVFILFVLLFLRVFLVSTLNFSGEDLLVGFIIEAF